MVCAHRGEKESSSGSRLARGLQSIWYYLLLIFIKERELHHHRGREEDQGILYELSLLFLLSPPSIIYVLFLLLLLQTLLLIFMCMWLSDFVLVFAYYVPLYIQALPLRMYIHVLECTHCIAVSRVWFTYIADLSSLPLHSVFTSVLHTLNIASLPHCSPTCFLVWRSSIEPLDQWRTLLSYQANTSYAEVIHTYTAVHTVWTFANSW